MYIEEGGDVILGQEKQNRHLSPSFHSSNPSPSLFLLLPPHTPTPPHTLLHTHIHMSFNPKEEERDKKMRALQLLQACRTGDLPKVVSLSSQFPSLSWETTLETACRHGQTHVVEYLLSHPSARINPNGTKETKETPLHIAAQEGYAEIVKMLLAHPGISTCNSGDADGATPFWFACLAGHLHVVRCLRDDARVDVNQGNANGATGLYVACQRGWLHVVNALLDHPQVDVNRGRKDGATPLYIACQNGHHEVVSLLFRYPNLRLNDRTDEGATSFFIACQKGHLRIIKMFLDDPRIDVNCPTKDGSTPLAVALGFGQIKALALLLTSGRNISHHTFTAVAEAERLDLLPTWISLLQSVRKDLVSPRDVAVARGITSTVAILDNYERDPAETKLSLWRTLEGEEGIGAPANEVCALIVFLCDGFLRFRGDQGLRQENCRFLRIAMKLPLEIQMTLSCRTFRSAKDVIPSSDLEPVFKLVVRKYLLEQSI